MSPLMTKAKVSTPAGTTTINPAAGKTLKTYPFLDAAGINASLSRSVTGLKQWRDTRVEDRAAMLSRRSR
jgi:acyl-CoA reductase-like NAD-dependent aldehyde dehydrogenase